MLHCLRQCRLGFFFIFTLCVSGGRVSWHLVPRSLCHAVIMQYNISVVHRQDVNILPEIRQ